MLNQIKFTNRKVKYEIHFIDLMLYTSFSFSQKDTVCIELNNSSLSLRKCRGILFNEFIGNTFSYPGMDKITNADHLFIFNKEIINFKIYKNGKLIIQGKKLAELHAYDTISFYRNGKLTRKEVWVDHLLITRNGQNYSAGDDATWISRQYFRNTILRKEYFKTIESKDDEKLCVNTFRKKNRKEKKVNSKCFI